MSSDTADSMSIATFLSASLVPSHTGTMQRSQKDATYAAAVLQERNAELEGTYHVLACGKPACSLSQRENLTPSLQLAHGKPGSEKCPGREQLVSCILGAHSWICRIVRHPWMAVPLNIWYFLFSTFLGSSVFNSKFC